MSFDVVTFGETMGSVRAAGLLRHGGAMVMGLGGAESNVAIALARLGHTVRWAGRLGADEVGSFALRTLRAESVDISTVVVDPARPTGLLLVEKRISDLSRVAYYRRSSAASALHTDDLRDSFDTRTRLLHVTGITPALSAGAAEATLWAVSAAKDLGVTVSFDVNYRAALWEREAASTVLDQVADLADIVFASDDELGLIAGGATERERVADLAARGVQQVVITRGAGGSEAWQGDEHANAEARAVMVVDTIGAGDAFTAGYLSAMLDGEGLAERLERGSVLGAFAVSASGDWEALPSRAELDLIDRVAGSTIR